MEPVTWTVEDHLAGQPAGSVALYRRFVDMVEECGPFAYSVTKGTITFKGSRRGFAGARPTPRGLSVYLDLQRVIEDRRIISVAPYTKRLFVHQIRLTAPDDLDEEFRGWVREAYAVGQGAHMSQPKGDEHISDKGGSGPIPLTEMSDRMVTPRRLLTPGRLDGCSV